MALPPPSVLSDLPTEEIGHVLALLFEPSPALVALLSSDIKSSNFPSYDTLITHASSRMTALVPESTDAPSATLDAILGSHPRLGAPKSEHLSAASRAEQAQLQSASSDEARKQAEALASLNAEYEAKFPGLRYVVFVNGRPRPEVMDDMRARIARGDPLMERMDAIAAMCDIAKDRVDKMGVASSVTEWGRAPPIA